MRIRKNKEKIAVEGTFLPKHSSLLVCQLNRSSWDDDFLFSQFIEDKWDRSLDLNVSLLESIPPLDRRSIPAKETMNLSSRDVDKTISLPPLPPPPQPPTKLVGEGRGKQIEVVLGAKTTSLKPHRGKRGGHHLAKCVPPPSAKRVAALMPPPPPPPLPPPPPPVSAPQKKRGRPAKKLTPATRKNGVGSDNNPYEFYYYSGFSPSWSKRRSGNKSSNNTNSNNVPTSIVTEGKKAKDHWLHGVIRGKGTTHDSSSSASQVMSDDDDNAIVNKKQGGSNNNNTTTKASVVETVVDERLDYIDDDDEEEEEEEEDGGLHGGKRIRPRKPIKARSLKSLM